MRVFSIGDRVSQPNTAPAPWPLPTNTTRRSTFDEHGPRTFATSLVKLERSTTTAPAQGEGDAPEGRAPPRCRSRSRGASPFAVFFL